MIRIAVWSIIAGNRFDHAAAVIQKQLHGRRNVFEPVEAVGDSLFRLDATQEHLTFAADENATHRFHQNRSPLFLIRFYCKSKKARGEVPFGYAVSTFWFYVFRSCPSQEDLLLRLLTGSRYRSV